MDWIASVQIENAACDRVGEDHYGNGGYADSGVNIQDTFKGLAARRDLGSCIGAEEDDHDDGRDAPPIGEIVSMPA